MNRTLINVRGSAMVWGAVNDSTRELQTVMRAKVGAKASLWWMELTVDWSIEVIFNYWSCNDFADGRGKRGRGLKLEGLLGSLLGLGMDEGDLQMIWHIALFS